MALLTLQDVHKRFGERQLLDGVTLRVEERERVGLLGANGCGKSTLMRIAAGLEVADEGRRSMRRGLRIGYLEQEPRLSAAATLREAVVAGLLGREQVLARLELIHAQLETPCAQVPEVERLLREQAALEDQLEQVGGYDVDHQVEALLAGLGLDDPERLCGPLSGGEARRVALARLLLSGPELMLLDEPTNHLDAQTIDWLEDRLLASRASLLMITHDRYVLDRVVHRIVELEQGRLYGYDGGYGDYLVARAEREQSERRLEASRLNLLQRETAWMRRGPPARSTKAKARKDRYHGLVDAAPAKAAAVLEFRIPAGPRLGTRVLEVKGLTKAFDGRALVSKLDLELAPGMRLGIIGPNGAGKTTLLQLVSGALAPDAGSVSVGPTVRFASIDQRRSQLDPDQTVLEHVAQLGDHVRVGDELRRVESFLEQFLFPGALKHAKVGTLSGGERNRLLLARLLCQGGNVLLLDEPTNDLDLMTLRALEEALVAYPGSVLVVSHDRYFLDRVATHVLHLDGQGGARVDACAVSDLLERLAAERQAAERGAAERGAAQRGAAQREAQERPAGERGQAGAAPVARRRLNNWEQKEYDQLFDQIAAGEAELAALDLRLADRALYSGPPDAARALQAQRAAVVDALEALHARWEELEQIQQGG